MRNLLLVCLLLLSAIVNAQGTYTPLGGDTYHIVDRLDIKYSKILPIPHTADKPYSKKLLGEYAESMYYSNLSGNRVFDHNLMYLLRDNTEWVDSVNTSNPEPVFNFFYKQPASLISMEEEGLTAHINPAVNISFGKDLSQDVNLFKFERGLELRAYVKKKVGVYLYVTTNQLLPPEYVTDMMYNQQYEAVPGEGYWKEYKTRGADYFTARGYFTFNLLDHFDFKFGHDKNFIGNGYRSLFLSDYSNNYLHLKLTTKVWKIQYTNLFAELTQQYERGGDRLLDKKYMALHHLNFNVTHWLDIGFFEGVILSRENQFDIQYLNPIIFYRSIEQELGSPDNAMIGFDFKANFLSHFSAYGQLLIDEFNFGQIKAANGWWANKTALQLGLKYIDVANIENLDLQLETNIARPYIYTHGNANVNGIANYTHYNQPLAHPLGANFREYIGIVRYQPIPQLALSLKYFNITTGIDTLGPDGELSHWGSSLFPTTNQNTVEMAEGNQIGQGVGTHINLIHASASYQPWHNVYVDLGVSYRHYNSDLGELDNNSFQIYLGTRINVPQRTFDF